MRTSVSLAAPLALIVLAVTVPPAQAGTSCYSCIPTFMSVIIHSGTHGTPNPTRIGNFVGHFDAAGVPQSIVEPSDTNVQIVEGPCVPVVKNGNYIYP